MLSAAAAARSTNGAVPPESTVLFLLSVAPKRDGSRWSSSLIDNVDVDAPPVPVTVFSLLNPGLVVVVIVAVVSSAPSSSSSSRSHPPPPPPPRRRISRCSSARAWSWSKVGNGSNKRVLGTGGSDDPVSFAMAS